jgi:hypothetical protein
MSPRFRTATLLSPRNIKTKGAKGHGQRVLRNASRYVRQHCLPAATAEYKALCGNGR